MTKTVKKGEVPKLLEMMELKWQRVESSKKLEEEEELIGNSVFFCLREGSEKLQSSFDA